LREKRADRFVDKAADGPRRTTARAEGRLEAKEEEMKQTSQRKPEKESPLGVKLLRSAQQARDWVSGEPGRVRVTYVRVPQVDVRKLRAKMGLSQTQFAARFGFSLDSIQNWEQGHRRPEGPARILLAVIAKNPHAVEEALGSY
jgi:putative transcriptional regulator